MFRNLRELYQYRGLLWSLTVRELKARYRASVLGFLWTFLNPTLNMAVYAGVFGYLLKQAQPAYPYFLFIGLLPWLFFSTSVGGGASSVSDRRDLLIRRPVIHHKDVRVRSFLAQRRLQGWKVLALVVRRNDDDRTAH